MKRAHGEERASHPPQLVRCPWCGAPTPANYVHGHVQCLGCKKNIDPCCEGEQAQPPDEH